VLCVCVCCVCCVLCILWLCVFAVCCVCGVLYHGMCCVVWRWQEHTEELYLKDLHDADKHDGVITHLEPDILEYEVKWALGSITINKASGSDFQLLTVSLQEVVNSSEFQLSYFKS